MLLYMLVFHYTASLCFPPSSFRSVSFIRSRTVRCWYCWYTSAYPVAIISCNAGFLSFVYNVVCKLLVLLSACAMLVRYSWLPVFSFVCYRIAICAARRSLLYCVM